MEAREWFLVRGADILEDPRRRDELMNLVRASEPGAAALPRRRSGVQRVPRAHARSEQGSDRIEQVTRHAGAR